MADWHSREMGASDNLAYIKAHTKPCPFCSTPVERSEGCMHMVCATCQAAGRKKDWCWICGQPWDFEGRHSNFWYNPPCKDDPQVQEKTCHVNKVQTALYRYIQYYSGYAEHEKTRRFQVTKDTEKAEEYKRRITEHNPGVDGEFVMLAVNSLVTARTYLKFSYVYGYHLSDDKQPFFDWKVKGVEQEVSKLSNMMEDLYRHDMLSTEGPPWNRDQVVDQAALLKQKLEDVMQGFTVDEEA
jgi:ariadne-1